MPSEIIYLDEKYKVIAVADYVVEEVINKLESIELPGILEENEMYEKVVNLIKSKKEIEFNDKSNKNLSFQWGCYVL